MHGGKKMKIVYLGQAGFLVETSGLRIVIDPYLSDSVGAMDAAKRRRVPVDPSFFGLRPDVLIFTHSHLDHYDPATAEEYLRRYNGITVLSPSTVWGTVRQQGKSHNYVLFDRGTRWTEGAARFTSVPAAHSDAAAVGIVLQAEGKTLYFTGDTLYHEGIFPHLPVGIDLIFLPVNGAGNNMNAADAADFAARCGAKWAVPMHTGLLDDLSADIYTAGNRILPEIYKELNWEGA